MIVGLSICLLTQPNHQPTPTYQTAGHPPRCRRARRGERAERPPAGPRLRFRAREHEVSESSIAGMVIRLFPTPSIDRSID